MVGMIEDTRAVLHAADVLLCTSRTEGVPGVLIEAALCGLPVVTTDVGGVSSVVGAGPHLVPVDASPSVIAAEVSSVRGPARRDTEQTLDVVHAWESLLGHLERPPAEP
jgi:glycosyltransferase involved in cell wall biosynthesis